MTTGARDFVGKHTAQDVEGNAEARKRAGSLLDLHTRVEAVREAVGPDVQIMADATETWTQT